jgi:hypothetical protein
MAIFAVTPPILALPDLALVDVGSTGWPSFDGAFIDQTNQELRDSNQPRYWECQATTAMYTLLPPKWFSLSLLLRVLLSPVNSRDSHKDYAGGSQSNEFVSMSSVTPLVEHFGMPWCRPRCPHYHYAA